MRSLPNLLSLARLACAPLLVALALDGRSRPAFLALLGLALLTDALDGAVARRTATASELGRRLDSWADHALLAAAVAGICLLWPETARRERAWLAAGIAAYFAHGVYVYARWRILPGYHSWAWKLTAVALAPAVALLLLGREARPFHLVVAMMAVSGLESLAIALILPGFSGEVPTAWHAWRRRESRGPAGRADAQKERCSSR